MIRLKRANQPEELTAALEAELTAEFKTTASSVWNKPFIREALLVSSASKCAYCEANVAEESKYMEVEHFRCKSEFPDLVVQWENLLPSCKRCNGHKLNYNVDTEGMIINPFSADPKDHVYFQNYRLRWHDEIGRRSIDQLYLNDTDRMVSVRLQIGERIAQSLEAIRLNLEDYLVGPQATRKRNAVTRGMEQLLRQAVPKSEFSALAATVLLSDPNYSWIKQNLTTLGLWGDLAGLETSAAEIALPP